MQWGKVYEAMDHRDGKSEKAGRGRGRSHLTTLETESKKTSPLPGLPLCCAHFGLSGSHGLQLLSGGQQYPFCDHVRAESEESLKLSIPAGEK